MVFVYNVEYYLNVCPVSEQSFSQVWSDLAQRQKKENNNNFKFLDRIEFKVQQDILLQYCFWECDVNVSV